MSAIFTKSAFRVSLTEQGFPRQLGLYEFGPEAELVAVVAVPTPPHNSLETCLIVRAPFGTEFGNYVARRLSDAELREQLTRGWQPSPA